MLEKTETFTANKMPKPMGVLLSSELKITND